MPGMYALKLTDADVAAIRASSSTIRALSIEYGAAYQTIWKILKRKARHHLSSETDNVR
jgi:lambda repressor-like predicted transcriptional regulator